MLEAQENSLNSSDTIDNSNSNGSHSNNQGQQPHKFHVDIGALQELFHRNHSTKVAWLIQFLQTTTRQNKGEKIVVVTQVTDKAFCDIIKDSLNRL